MRRQASRNCRPRTRGGARTVEVHRPGTPPSQTAHFNGGGQGRPHRHRTRRRLAHLEIRETGTSPSPTSTLRPDGGEPLPETAAGSLIIVRASRAASVMPFDDSEPGLPVGALIATDRCPHDDARAEPENDDSERPQRQEPGIEAGPGDDPGHEPCESHVEGQVQEDPRPSLAGGAAHAAAPPPWHELLDLGVRAVANCWNSCSCPALPRDRCLDHRSICGNMPLDRPWLLLLHASPVLSASNGLHFATSATMLLFPGTPRSARPSACGCSHPAGSAPPR